jgi:hypothetical protein
MNRIKEVKTLSDFRIWLRFEDGACGEVDLSGLAGKGVFSLWEQPGEFEKVSIAHSGELIWGNQVDLCSDALYLKVTGKKPEDLFPTLKQEYSHA